MKSPMERARGLLTSPVEWRKGGFNVAIIARLIVRRSYRTRSLTERSRNERFSDRYLMRLFTQIVWPSNQELLYIELYFVSSFPPINNSVPGYMHRGDFSC